MNKERKTSLTQVNAGAMADIAFLLLTFFMVTTVMTEEKGLTLSLPPFSEPTTQSIHNRNLFAIQLNSHDQLMVEGQRQDNTSALRHDLKKFLLNYGASDQLSESPQKAVVSLKTDRGTSHQAFIHVLDEIQGAYYEIYAERAGIPADKFRKLDTRNENERKLYEKGRKDFPMNISIAEPTHVHH